MTDETQENDFSAFEAAATADEPEVTEVTPEEGEGAEEPDTNVNDEAGEPEGDKPEKGRSKPAHERIAEITKARREAERERDELRQRIEALESGKAPEQSKPQASEALKAIEAAQPDPNDPKYEFGEADPQYLADLTDWKVDVRLAKRDAELAEKQEKAEQEQRQAAMQKVASNLDTSWQEKAKAGAEKYDDFNEVVLEGAAAEAWPCPPLVAIGIASSDQGADIAYHLAKNPTEAEELAKLSVTDPMEAARRFGRLEARFETPAANTNARRVTNAPEPPKHTARGAGGKFEVDGSTTDFAAFERKANAGR